MSMFPDLTRDDVFRLETRRLWLRWPRLSDAQAIIRLAGDRVIADMTAKIPHPYPSDAADRFIFQARQDNADGSALTLAVTPKNKPNALIGVIGIVREEASDLPQLGYWLGQSHWGQGLMSEAAQAVVAAFFTIAPHDVLLASTRIVNSPSQRVLEKCGFEFEQTGTMLAQRDGEAMEVRHFRLTRERWQQVEAAKHADFVRIPSVSERSESVERFSSSSRAGGSPSGHFLTAAE